MLAFFGIAMFIYDDKKKRWNKKYETMKIYLLFTEPFVTMEIRLGFHPFNLDILNTDIYIYK